MIDGILAGQNAHRPVVYFHGQPGSPRELEMFGRCCPQGWWAPDRAALNEQNLDALAALVRDHCGDVPSRLVGFSLGAFVALAVASRLPDQDLFVDLVSPAAPLDDPALLNTMAGGAVFRLALRHPSIFAAVAAVQGFIARLVPGQLTRMLLASVRGDDRALADDADFRRAMAENLRQGLGHSSDTYRREIMEYVADWSGVLSVVRHPVSIWQGDSDNWTPPSMAARLAAALPNVTAFHRLPGTSHYSTLRAYLDCQQR